MFPGADPSQQYQVHYYASGPGIEEPSNLIVEWANQHGCGSNPKVQVNLIFYIKVALLLSYYHVFYRE